MTRKNKNIMGDTNLMLLGAIATLSKPYIIGASVQLERYIVAVNSKEKDASICIYEASALLEHLNCVYSYFKKIGCDLPCGTKINDFRNHMRHDARLDGDHSNGKRRQRVGLNEKMLVGITFLEDCIKMGDEVLTINQINDFLEKSKNYINGIFV